MKSLKPLSRAALLLRRAKISEKLPPLEEVMRGSFLERQVRCGKPTCRCAKGPGHPILYVSVTFPGGGTQQVTVPRHLVRTVRLWTSNYLRWWQAIEEVSAINRRLLQLREIPSDELAGEAAPSASPRSRGRGR